MPATDRFVSETTFPIRFAETDAMGIIHHAAFMIYMEAALCWPIDSFGLQVDPYGQKTLSATAATPIFATIS